MIEEVIVKMIAKIQPAFIACTVLLVACDSEDNELREEVQRLSERVRALENESRSVTKSEGETRHEPMLSRVGLVNGVEEATNARLAELENVMTEIDKKVTLARNAPSEGSSGENPFVIVQNLRSFGWPGQKGDTVEARSKRIALKKQLLQNHPYYMPATILLELGFEYVQVGGEVAATIVREWGNRLDLPREDVVRIEGKVYKDAGDVANYQRTLRIMYQASEISLHVRAEAAFELASSYLGEERIQEVREMCGYIVSVFSGSKDVRVAEIVSNANLRIKKIDGG